MWTVYLVEDEVFVRQAIREILAWEKHGFHVVGEAGTGKDALTDIRNLKPDVVICDIVMPGMDGIELLRQVREDGIPSRFLMLTAMSDFNYARDALQYGATNYLLKLSLSDEIILDNLSRIKGELLNELQRKGESLYQLYYQSWAEKWRHGGMAEPSGKPIAMPDVIDSLYLTVYTVLTGSETISWEQLVKMGIAPNDAYLLIHPFMEAGETAFFCWSMREDTGPLTTLKIGGYPIAVVKGGTLSTLAHQWGLALKQLDQFWYGEASSPVKSSYLAERELEADFLLCFEERHETKCIELMDAIWGGMSIAGYSHIEVKQAAIRLAEMIVTLARGREVPKELVLGERSHLELLQAMKHWVTACIRKMNEEEGLYTDHPDVNRVIRYMLEHFRENISVKDLAKLASMNVDYLSTLFRRKTGQTPVSFLQNVRIGHAKQLLHYSEWSVAEIADQTGFTDDAYFIKLFKREVGQTPSAYRKAKVISDLSY
ncbi:response regulator [Paenibacillus qinlingensis]|uniref:Two-component system response regulator YesN n=1 Tax=Paenibacillus qinlingensis TaxID=1837343 RepID=A0ABU1NSC8_9BACL|nr:response regulator [Paenibacillus qinlingensis]MDR6550391.1 two-component system response regulator YesN [Paenibacillus qinlingensis]